MDVSFLDSYDILEVVSAEKVLEELDFIDEGPAFVLPFDLSRLEPVQYLRCSKECFLQAIRQSSALLPRCLLLWRRLRLFVYVFSLITSRCFLL